MRSNTPKMGQARESLEVLGCHRLAKQSIGCGLLVRLPARLQKGCDRRHLGLLQIRHHDLIIQESAGLHVPDNKGAFHGSHKSQLLICRTAVAAEMRHAICMKKGQSPCRDDHAGNLK